MPLLATPSLAAEQAGPEIADFTLANGLELVVIPDHRAPVVTHMIWYKVGAADETPGKSGLAHFLEHLMFKGTAKNPTGRFSQVVARSAARRTPSPRRTTPAISSACRASQLKTVMEFEADRMTGLQLTDDVVLPERNVILEEQNQRVGNNPRARLAEQVDAALFLNHPYGKPVIGWRHEMEELSRDDAIGFYRRFYAPNNAVVVIAGDVDPAQRARWRKRPTARLRATPRSLPRMRAQEPPPVAVRSLTLADPRVEIPIHAARISGAVLQDGQAGESEALEVLSHILGSGSNSRLYRALVVDKQVAVMAGAWYDSALSICPNSASRARRAPASRCRSLKRTSTRSSPRSSTRASPTRNWNAPRTRLIADAVYAQDNQASMARWYGASLTTGATVNDVLHWPDRIRAVTADQVRDAARQWLDKRRSVTGYLIKDVSPQAEKRS